MTASKRNGILNFDLTSTGKTNIEGLNTGRLAHTRLSGFHVDDDLYRGVWKGAQAEELVLKVVKFDGYDVPSFKESRVAKVNDRLEESNLGQSLSGRFQPNICGEAHLCY